MPLYTRMPAEMELSDPCQRKTAVETGAASVTMHNTTSSEYRLRSAKNFLDVTHLHAQRGLGALVVGVTDAQADGCARKF